MKKSKQILVFAAVLIMFLLLLKWNEKIDDKKEEFATNQTTEENEQEAIQTTAEISFFQEDALDFLSENMVEHVEEVCSLYVKTEGEEGVSCAVILSNVLSLSKHTYRFFLQTNESQNNLYQVIVNEKEMMVDIERYDASIDNIESYGGVGYGDNIEAIYIYGDGTNEDELTERELTLDEEMQAKDEALRNGDQEGE